MGLTQNGLEGEKGRTAGAIQVLDDRREEVGEEKIWGRQGMLGDDKILLVLLAKLFWGQKRLEKVFVPTL